MLKAEEIKVVILGATGSNLHLISYLINLRFTLTGVGKSSITLRFVFGDFKEDNESTLGAAFLTKMLVHNGESAKFQVLHCII